MVMRPSSIGLLATNRLAYSYIGCKLTPQRIERSLQMWNTMWFVFYTLWVAKV